MRIGELARRTGVSTRLLRYYEQQGLLLPTRQASGYREYVGEDDVARVRHIRTLLAAGLSTATIGVLLQCMGADGPRLVADCPDLVVDLYRERERLTAAVHELETARSVLDGIIATAPPETERAAAGLLRGDAVSSCASTVG